MSIRTGNGIRSVFSQLPVQIVMCDQGGAISYGSGFYYRRHAKRYLITNKHNLTGKDVFTGRNLDTVGARTPLWIQVRSATYVNGSTDQFAILPRRVELYADPVGPFDQLWLEHPTEPICDVVAVEDPGWPEEPPSYHHCVNELAYNNIPIEPGQPAFVIGFPQALSTGFGLPIWKSTYIASEPHYRVTVGGRPSELGLQGGHSLPAFFLDGYTRQGMSGSPVVGSYSGIWDKSAPYADVDMVAAFRSGNPNIVFSGTGYEFLGVYSGRVPQTETEAVLGLCWSKDLLDTICDQASRGQA